MSINVGCTRWNRFWLAMRPVSTVIFANELLIMNQSNSFTQSEPNNHILLIASRCWIFNYKKKIISNIVMLWAFDVSYSLMLCYVQILWLAMPYPITSRNPILAVNFVVEFQHGTKSKKKTFQFFMHFKHSLSRFLGTFVNFIMRTVFTSSKMLPSSNRMLSVSLSKSGCILCG